MARTVYNIQRDFAISSGLRSEIIWDSLAPDQSEILKQKIETLMPGTGGVSESELERMRRNLFENIWAQRKYTNRSLLSAIVYVMVTTEQTYASAIESTEFSCHPVFRTRKCLNANNNSTGCCMVFVDEHARVYSNWQEYIANNILPKGTMVAPANGIYTFSDADEVLLEFHVTTHGRAKSQLLNATDRVASVGSMMATVPIMAALAFPVAAPVLTAVTAVTVTTAAYTTLRSAMRLKDRRKHCQSTAITDRGARSSWLGVATGVVGLGATGATKALTSAAAAGREITLGTQLAVHGINVSSILLSGSGVANGVYELYMKYNDDSFSSMDVLQLATSLLVFTHSINNLKLATMVATHKRGVSIRRQLTNEIRNTFDKIRRETAKVHGIGGTHGGKFDIIRTVNDIPFKDALMSLHNINSHLSGSTLTAAGIAQFLPNSILKLSTDNNLEVNIAHLAEEYGCKFVQHIGNVNSLVDVLDAMATYLCPRVSRFLMCLARGFIDDSVTAIDRTLNTFVATETVLYKIFMHCVTKYSNFAYEFLEANTAAILEDVAQYFHALNPINLNSSAVQQKCEYCTGHFYRSTL